MPNKNTRWENDKEWFGWTIRDEIYGVVRQYVGPIVVTAIASLAGTIWSFLSQYRVVGTALGASGATLVVISILALIDGSKRTANAEQGTSPLVGTPTIAASMTAMYRPAPENTKEVPFVQFTTEGRQAREIATFAKPDKLRFVIPSELVVTENDLPVSMPVGKGRLIIKRFTEKGFAVEEQNTIGGWIKAEVYCTQKPEIGTVEQEVAKILSATTPKERMGAAEPSISPMRLHPHESMSTKHQEPLDFRDYPRIYNFETDGTLRLLFLPDTDEKTQDGDALLVLTLGRTLMTGADEVPIIYSDKSMLRSGVKRRYSKGREGELERLRVEMQMDFLLPRIDPDAPDLEAIAKSQIDCGYIRKVALSRGGAYQLTEQGKTRALHLLRDMIERA